MTHHQPELDDNDKNAGEDTEHTAFAKRLSLLVTRYAISNWQAMLDFDHLGMDGLDDFGGNVLAEMGPFTLLDRDKQ
ncbi:hypothetical protein ED208_11255 [Stagnimonas aquatica]|uniref:Uncharacterized protein n=1 Tax=Stagnimonas aquatica TaxID=2689987 RepID=A0A3N0VAL1_9GAMM|nr:hypothetical protein [Stagnimonas aquatica]ROH89692.1 hypothetical protein ED208_11255 [Stagnimonas aquatica]